MLQTVCQARPKIVGVVLVVAQTTAVSHSVLKLSTVHEPTRSCRNLLAKSRKPNMPLVYVVCLWALGNIFVLMKRYV